MFYCIMRNDGEVNNESALKNWNDSARRSPRSRAMRRASKKGMINDGEVVYEKYMRIGEE